MTKQKHHAHVLSLVLLIGLVLPPTICAQTLKEKLESHTSFRPTQSDPVDQLIEVAHQFNIPMAIEWLEPESKQSRAALNFSEGSVENLVRAILEKSAHHRLVIDDGMLFISAPAAVSHPFNFLNLRIESFALENAAVFDAEADLRHSINRMLYPDQYRNGYGGGYGGPSPHPFWTKNITFSGDHLTIREILTKIAQRGNALWVVRFDPKELRGDKPSWSGVPVNEYGHSPLNSRWRFLPLSKEHGSH